jgi:alpha-galactosidase
MVGFCRSSRWLWTCAALLIWLVATGSGELAAQEPERTISVGSYTVQILGDLEGFALTIDTAQAMPGVTVVQLKLSREVAAPPPALTLRWSLPSHDIVGLWTTSTGLYKTIGPDWYPSRVTSMLATQSPVLQLFGGSDQNRLTVAVSDALNAVTLKAGVREEDGLIYGQVDLFVEKHRAVTAVALDIRFDWRDLPYSEVLAEVSNWWTEYPGYTPAAVPETARLPMYSTWYSYHQNVESGALLREVEIAKQLGFEDIIIDDGWQTLDSQRGYAYTGDWEPERIPEMRAFVDGVHERGMKFLLWYAVPLVGERSKIFSQFEGKYLRYWDGQGAYELDPRYPEVREHIIGTYEKALKDWDVDGFKLDFMGRFVARSSTVLEAGDGRDFASVNDATDRLMTDLLAGLRRIDPEVMIEFRQPYIGPLMRKYGNMFRAGDAPNSAMNNRVRTIDLRLLSGSTAVHSDMIMWHYQEPVESAALQFLNILFSVPQVSVRLEEIPGEHLEMIRFYTRYWTDNRSVLLDGMLEARNPLANYPLVRAWDDRKQISVIYADLVVPIDGRPTDKIDIINATGGARVVVETGVDLGRYRLTVRDSRGREVNTGEVMVEAGLHTLSVPPAGLLSLERLANDP